MIVIIEKSRGIGLQAAFLFNSLQLCLYCVLCIYYVCVDSCTNGCSQHMGFGLHAIKGTQQIYISYVLLVQHSFSGQWNSRTHTWTVFSDRCWVASNPIGPNKRIRCSEKIPVLQATLICATLSNFLWPFNVTISHTRGNCTHFLHTCTTTNWWVH